MGIIAGVAILVELLREFIRMCLWIIYIVAVGLFWSVYGLIWLTRWCYRRYKARKAGSGPRALPCEHTFEPVPGVWYPELETSEPDPPPEKEVWRYGY